MVQCKQSTEVIVVAENATLNIWKDPAEEKQKQLNLQHGVAWHTQVGQQGWCLGPLLYVKSALRASQSGIPLLLWLSIKHTTAGCFRRGCCPYPAAFEI